MIIIGLTGSIAMGKSFVARLFRHHNVPVFDADAAVQELYQKNKVQAALLHHFGESVLMNGQVNRAALRQRLVIDSQAKQWLESLVHPLVRTAMADFVRRHHYRRARMIVLDIPLLLETRGDRFCDATVVVSCRDFLQSQRYLRRKGATAAMLAAYRRWQYPDAAKRQAADFVIATGLAKSHTYRQVKRLYRRLRDA